MGESYVATPVAGKTLVNGQRLQGRRGLVHGDVLEVASSSSSGSPAPRRPRSRRDPGRTPALPRSARRPLLRYPARHGPRVPRRRDRGDRARRTPCCETPGLATASPFHALVLGDATAVERALDDGTLALDARRAAAADDAAPLRVASRATPSATPRARGRSSTRRGGCSLAAPIPTPPSSRREYPGNPFPCLYGASELQRQPGPHPPARRRRRAGRRRRIDLSLDRARRSRVPACPARAAARASANTCSSTCSIARTWRARRCCSTPAPIRRRRTDAARPHCTGRWAIDRRPSSRCCSRGARRSTRAGSTAALRLCGGRAVRPRRTGDDGLRDADWDRALGRRSRPRPGVPGRRRRRRDARAGRRARRCAGRRACCRTSPMPAARPRCWN